jgi:hypothetical protein
MALISISEVRKPGGTRLAKKVYRVVEKKFGGDRNECDHRGGAPRDFAISPKYDEQQRHSCPVIYPCATQFTAKDLGQFLSFIRQRRIPSHSSPLDLNFA